MTFDIKPYLILLMIVIGSLTTRANDNHYLLALKYLDDGGNTKTSYVKLADKPIVTLASEKLEISSSNIALLYEKVVSISFVDSETTIIDGVLSDDKLVPRIISFDGTKLILSGIESKSKISLYTIDGKIVANEFANDMNEVVISMSSLPNAAYIVKTNKKSFKIIKK